MSARPLVLLGEELRRAGYTFTTVTPLSHARLNARPSSAFAGSIRDVFGFSRPFAEGLLPAAWMDWLEGAGALQRDGERFRSRVRYSTLGDDLYVHSAFPTEGEDAVFFGPDTYRFVRFLRANVREAGRVVDVGCGSGAGGLSLRDRATSVILGDINERALALARSNAELAHAAETTIVQSDVLSGVEGPIDTVLANPPYLVDAEARTYRHGGDDLGTALAVRIAHEARARLAPGGRLLLYTGAPVVGGEDQFKIRVLPLFSSDFRVSYEEIDPDVFGEELERPAYADVERIAAVGLVAIRKS